MSKLKEDLKESFSRLKNDIQDLNISLEHLSTRIHKVEQRKLEIDEELIRKIVVETVKSLDVKKPKEDFITRKIRRNKRELIKTRIRQLLRPGRMSLSELRDIIAYDEKLCSRATFYRYIKRMIKSDTLQSVSIDDVEYVQLNMADRTV